MKEDKVLIIGRYSKRLKIDPAEDTKGKANELVQQFDGTEVVFGDNGHIGEIVREQGFPIAAATEEELATLVVKDERVRYYLDLDKQGAVNELRYNGSELQEGNLGVMIYLQQVAPDGTIIHNGIIKFLARRSEDGLLRPWVIINDFEYLPLAPKPKFDVTREEAVRRAAKAILAKLKLSRYKVKYTVEDAQIALNANPERLLEKVWRLRLHFSGPKLRSASIEAIVTCDREVVFARRKLCTLMLAARTFLAEQTPVKNYADLEAQLRPSEIDADTLDKDSKTGRPMLKNSKVTMFFDPKAKGKPTQMVVAFVDKTGKVSFNFPFTDPRCVSVIVFQTVMEAINYHLRAKMQWPQINNQDKNMPVWVAEDSDQVTDNAGFDPDKYDVHLGVFTQKGKSWMYMICVEKDITNHELGHMGAENEQSDKHRISGHTWHGFDEGLADGDAYLMRNEDLVKNSKTLGRKFGYDDFISDQGLLAAVTFEGGLRKMESEWTFTPGMFDGMEVHDIGEKLTAPLIHTAKAWMKGEYEKRITDSMSEDQKQAVFNEVCLELVLVFSTTKKKAI